jgi:hypothetical protein
MVFDQREGSRRPVDLADGDGAVEVKTGVCAAARRWS